MKNSSSSREVYKLENKMMDLIYSLYSNTDNETLYNDITPRDYQLEILEIAKARNTIAFLDTGTGKTLIAIMLTKWLSGKAVFLTPTKALIEQQDSVAKKFNIRCDWRSGKKGESWNSIKWQNWISKFDLLFLTPQLFLNSLRHGYLQMEQFDLLIYDECHHCKGEHPYFSIQTEFYFTSLKKPKILGLTASPVVTGPKEIKELKSELSDLCLFLDSDFAQVNRRSVNQIASQAKVIVKGVDHISECKSDIIEELSLIMKSNINMRDHFDSAKTVFEKIGEIGLKYYLRDFPYKNELLHYFETQLEEGYSELFLELVHLLNEHFSLEESSQVIILAERRVTVWYLVDALNYFSNLYNLNIKAGKVVGINQGSRSSEICKMKNSSHEYSLDDFRLGNINVLVATTVVEEGIDIPSCNFVIRYDSPPNNLRSYVQSKGRARDKDSKFIVLTPMHNQAETIDLIRRFDYMIVFLKNLADKPITKPERGMTSYVSFKIPETGATISTAWSELWVKDFETALKKLTGEKIKYETSYIREVSKVKGYSGIVKFPSLFCIEDVKSSRLYCRENDALKDAIVQAAEALYQNEFIDEFLFQCIEKGLRATDSKLRYKNSKSSVCSPFDDKAYLEQNSIEKFIGNLDSFYHIYKLIISDQQSELSLGLFSTADIPECPFDLFSSKYNINSSIKQTQNPSRIRMQLIRTERFDLKNLSMVKAFHLTINSILCSQFNRTKRNIYEEHIGNAVSDLEIQVPLCVVPILDDNINWNIIKSNILFLRNPAKFDSKSYENLALKLDTNDLYIILDILFDSPKHEVYNNNSNLVACIEREINEEYLSVQKFDCHANTQKKYKEFLRRSDLIFSPIPTYFLNLCRMLPNIISKIDEFLFG
ncbi:unnamed protein product [Blepharisma stoltei]|uniref:Dicer-like protein n=1 Tax=Blepharisma stoltei TaxID=1481888 RepID=A0AAU9IRZ7_9CILI|nr:unnamed protein product [Blepharisma stoltei]